MQAWLLLILAIVCEVIATTALKASEGFTRLVPSAIVVLGYGGAFLLLAQSLRDIPLGVTYALWSGAGTAIIAVLGMIFFGETLDFTRGAGIALIVVGVVVLNLSGGAH
jgi:small multidrug resistance pump